MSDKHKNSKCGVDWLQSIEDESESDIASRSTSSTLSWTDEAEKEISEEMRNQFELFESALYSELDGEELPVPLIEEVAIWKQHSPHLRINGLQITPTFHNVEDKYPEDYEEVLAIHSDQDEIANSFKRQCSISEIVETVTKELNESMVDSLFDKIWPINPKQDNHSVRSEIEASLSSKLQSPREGDKSFHILDETLQIVEPPMLKGRRAPLSSRSCLSRHEYKCNHITEYEDSTDQSLKPPSCRQRRLSPSKIQRRQSSSYSANRASKRGSTASSARLPKRKSLVPEFTSNISHIAEKSDSGSVRFGILPPIQAIPITPKLPSKRANSAMLRFSKTLPRTRPNTSRNQAIFLKPIEDSDSSERCLDRSKDIEIIPHGDGHLSPLAPHLPHCTPSKQIKQLKIPRRWRY